MTHTDSVTIKADASTTQTESRIQRRAVRPEWLTPTAITFWLGLLGSAAYAILYSFDFSFLGEFGVSPEEVGLSQTALIIRAAIYAAIAFLLVAMLGAIFAFGIRLAYHMAYYMARWVLWVLAMEVIDVRPLRRAVITGISKWRDRSARDSRVHIYSLGTIADIKRRTWAISLLCAVVGHISRQVSPRFTIWILVELDL
jgi:hypothetical protein